jgi:predicted DNA-binding transcriptional regulator AlpA
MSSNKTEEPSEFMRVSQIARKFGVSKATIYRWRADPSIGFPQGVSPGNWAVLYRRAEIEAFIKRAPKPGKRLVGHLKSRAAANNDNNAE